MPDPPEDDVDFREQLGKRVLFLDGAEFTKGVPEMVCNLEELVAEFGEPDKAAAKFKIEAFTPHWELIRKAAG